MFIIVSRSQIKSGLKKGEAVDIYAGRLFKLVAEYAKLTEYNCGYGRQLQLMLKLLDEP